MDVGLKYRRADDGSNGRVVRELMTPPQPDMQEPERKYCLTAQPRVSNFQNRCDLSSRDLTALRLGR